MSAPRQPVIGERGKKMRRKNVNAVWDLLGAALGVSCIEWDDDFEPDGYTDIWGRAPLGEPVFGAPFARRAPVIEVVDCRAADDSRRASV